jgi:nicotinamide riboside kinase
MVLICVEGPQRSGKSTLIEKLSKATGIPVWRRPVEIEKFKEETESWELFVLDELSIINAIDWRVNSLIVDRHPAVSEWIYTDLYGRKSRVPYMRISLLPEHSIFIFLLEEVGVLVERGREAEEASHELQHYADIAIMLSPHRRVLILPSPHKKTEDALIKECLTFISGNKRSI